MEVPYLSIRTVRGGAVTRGHLSFTGKVFYIFNHLHYFTSDRNMQVQHLYQRGTYID